MTTTVCICVNAENIVREIPDNRLLIDFLREDLKLTGTKDSCGVGVCGGCTVQLDGRPVSACIMLAVYANDCSVTTIEGLAKDGVLHPVQEAFLDYGGYQCGICTPGQIMAAKSLLDINPAPSREEIKEWMMGNLCRCTGYYKILESIEAAAKRTAP
jgi:aerobic-type carbon monoxide dehydrogenase small subunit (CoxS/CutS family)